MKYEIHYKDGTWELIRANSLTEAIENTMLEDQITLVKVYE